jgi:hypothetical protein
LKGQQSLRQSSRKQRQVDAKKKKWDKCRQVFCCTKQEGKGAKEQNKSENMQKFHAALAKRRDQVRTAVNSDSFSVIVIILILMNTVFLAVEYDGMPQVLVNFLESANTTFTVVFAIEMILKLFGLGFMDYIKDGFNCFDGIIVVIGLVELFGNLAGGNV